MPNVVFETPRSKVGCGIEFLPDILVDLVPVDLELNSVQRSEGEALLNGLQTSITLVTLRVSSFLSNVE